MGPTLEKKKKSRMQIGVCLQSVSLYCRWPTLYRAGLKRRKVRPPSPSALVSFISASLDVSAQRRMQKRRGEKKLSLDVPSLTRDGCIYTVSLAPAFSHALPATGDVPICQTRNFSEREKCRCCEHSTGRLARSGHSCNIGKFHSLIFFFLLRWMCVRACRCIPAEFGELII